MTMRHERNNRQDKVTEQKIEIAVKLADDEGVNFALDYMHEKGIPRKVALRVLCAPRFKRKSTN